MIVTELLLNYIPPGGTYSIGNKFKEIESNLRNVYNRNEIKHKRALADLPGYEAVLRSALDRILLQLNVFLIKYFKINLRVSYKLQPLTPYNYNNWSVPKDLRLDLRLNGVLILNQIEFLNEARLSALAICLYLAALKRNPQNFDYKILYLDDVFVGLDSGNRLPILNIVQNEFSEYQVFISTYDRHWFELAQRYFNSHAVNRWKSLELYVVKDKVGQATFEKPLVIPFEENFDRAVFYLHHRSKPDYPAAANYFRKSAEEIIKDYTPSQEIRDENYALIETHRLGALVNSSLHFLTKIGADVSLLSQLKNALPTLLHPLSHYDLASPVYKRELEEVERLLPRIKFFLINLSKSYRLMVPQGRMIKLQFIISATETGYYEIYTKESIYLLRNPAGLLSLSLGSCHSKTCYVMNGVTEASRHNFANNDTAAQYDSIENSYDSILNHIHTNAAFAHIPRALNPLSEFNYANELGSHTIEQHKGLVPW